MHSSDGPGPGHHLTSVREALWIAYKEVQLELQGSRFLRPPQRRHYGMYISEDTVSQPLKRSVLLQSREWSTGEGYRSMAMLLFLCAVAAPVAFAFPVAQTKYGLPRGQYSQTVLVPLHAEHLCCRSITGLF